MYKSVDLFELCAGMDIIDASGHEHNASDVDEVK